MKDFQKKAKQAVIDSGFIKSRVTTRNYNKKPAIKIYIPIEHNGTWNDEYRNRLNKLCNKLAAIGLLWAAEYSNKNRLISNDDDGQPWMLFNGGEAVDLKENKFLQSKLKSSLEQALIDNDEHSLAQYLVANFPNIYKLDILSNGGGFSYRTFKLNDLDVVISNESGEQGEFYDNDWTIALYKDFEQSNDDPIIIVSSEDLIK